MIRVALAQMNTTVGDIAGNATLIRSAIERADRAGAQVLVVPELAVTGYPPEDLLMKRSFVTANREALDELAGLTGDLLTIIGFVDQDPGHLFNAAAVCARGEVLAVYRKQLLPNYGVFDEERYFEPGNEAYLVETNHGVLGVCVCEDVWFEDGPAIALGDAGAEIVLNINASPFHKGKLKERAQMLGARARRARSSIVYVNAVGGQDELVFDGGSLVVDPGGQVIARAEQFREEFLVCDVPLGERRARSDGDVRTVACDLREVSGTATASMAPMPRPEEEMYEALVLALRDYVRKNGFDKVVVGLSGGIDSAMVAALAADGLGPSNVLAVAMPSEFSSSHSVEDAKALAANLDIELLEVPIAETYHAYLKALESTFGRAETGVAEENLQARIRGNLLMAISNRYGHLLVATGNKSEMACGYATLYGDMAGGFALLKDVFKTEVYALCRYRNERDGVIPENILTKPPSAELRPGQQDTDSLPPYDVLDPILEAYIERDEDPATIANAGFKRALVDKVIALVDRAEYKRRQAPPGPKVTTKAFGRDRRLPITNRWRPVDDAEFPARSVGEEGSTRS